MSSTDHTFPGTVQLRQTLRDYAREEVRQPVLTEDGAPPVQIFHGPRGQHAGKVFMALQNVLHLIENLELEADGPLTVSSSDPVAVAEQQTQKREMRRTTQLLRHAIDKGLS